MIKVDYLTENELEEIGETYANYNYPENDKGMFPFDDKELLKKYIMGFAKFCMECGMLYTTSENHEGYIAYSAPDTKHPMKAVRTFFRDVVGALGGKRFLTFTKFCQSGGKSIEAQMKERKEKFVMVELLVVNEKYQGKGYMRPLMEFAIETADRYKLPLIIDTDEGVKRDKYCHLGVHQVTGRDFGDSRYSYGMIRECGS